MKNALKISEAASLGIHAMAIISQKEELISVKEVAKILDVSANHLSKVLQRLVKSGLVISIKGFGGGFKLAKAPEEITFLAIYEAIDGEMRFTHCLLDSTKCTKPCIMGGLIESLNSQVKDFFSTTKLSDFPQ